MKMLQEDIRETAVDIAEVLSLTGRTGEVEARLYEFAERIKHRADADRPRSLRAVEAESGRAG